MASEKTVQGADIGHVGTVRAVDPGVIHALLSSGFVPVISPIGMDEKGLPLNINADDAACAIAIALGADKLVYLTDVEGILIDKDNSKTLLSDLSLKEAQDLMDSGMIAGGMGPKLQNCIDAVSGGVERVLVLDGRVEHTLLLEAVSAQKAGTAVYA